MQRALRGNNIRGTLAGVLFDIGLGMVVTFPPLGFVLNALILYDEVWGWLAV